MRSLVHLAMTLALLGGCRQVLGLDDLAPGSVDSTVVEPGVCASTATTCDEAVLTICEAGELPVSSACAWGCSLEDQPHCAQLAPAGGAVIAGELVAADVTDTSLRDTTINTDTGVITGVRSQGVGVVDGIRFEVRNKVGIFTFKSLAVSGTVQVLGSNAVALVADGAISIAGVLDVRGTCTTGSGGPGGGSGGAAGAPGSGPGAGSHGIDAGGRNGGGGGGGHGLSGGRGGANIGAPTLGGAPHGDPTIQILTGGGGGGSGGGPGGGTGGGGGGAIQLASNQLVQITEGGINAGGCGAGGAPTNAGGGGGAGGTILIEAPTVQLTAGGLAVNGGGGSGGEGGLVGENASLSQLPALGGTSDSADGGDGGDGGAAGSLAIAGQNEQQGGGGGGAVGRIRVNTLTGLTEVGPAGFTSPRFDSGSNTATQGLAQLQ